MNRRSRQFHLDACGLNYDGKKAAIAGRNSTDGRMISVGAANVKREAERGAQMIADPWASKEA